MGGGDKALLPLAGRPMLAHAIDAARAAMRGARPQRQWRSDALRRLRPAGRRRRSADFAGPLAGVLAGLEYCAAHAPQLTHVASLAADTPFAPRDFVARLTEAAAEGADIAVAASGGRTHHVAALWPVALAGDLRRALVGEGVRKVESVHERATASPTVEWPDEPIDPFFNVNTPEDLARAEAFLRGVSSGGGASEAERETRFPPALDRLERTAAVARRGRRRRRSRPAR